MVLRYKIFSSLFPPQHLETPQQRVATKYDFVRRNKALIRGASMKTYGNLQLKVGYDVILPSKS